MDDITLHSTSDCSAYKYNLFIYTLKEHPTIML